MTFAVLLLAVVVVAVALALALALGAAASRNDGDDDADVPSIVVRGGSLVATAPTYRNDAFRQALRAACVWDAAALHVHGDAVPLRKRDNLPAGLLQDIATVRADGTPQTRPVASPPRAVCAPLGSAAGHGHGHGGGASSTVAIVPNDDATRFSGIGGGAFVLRFTRPLRALVVTLELLDEGTFNRYVFTPGRGGRAGRPARFEVAEAIGAQNEAAFSIVVTDGGGFDELSISQTVPTNDGFCVVRVAYPCEQAWDQYRRRKRDALQDDDDGDDDGDVPTVAVDGLPLDISGEPFTLLSAFARTTEPACTFDVRALVEGDDVRDHLPAHGIRSIQFHGVFGAPNSPITDTDLEASPLLCPAQGVDQQAIVRADSPDAGRTQYSEPLANERFMLVLRFRRKVRSVTVTLAQLSTTAPGDTFTFIPGANGEEGDAVAVEAFLIDAAPIGQDSYTVSSVDGQGFDELAIVPAAGQAAFCVLRVALPCEQLRELYNKKGTELSNDDDGGGGGGGGSDYYDDSYDSDDDNDEDDDGNGGERSGARQRRLRAGRRSERPFV